MTAQGDRNELLEAAQLARLTPGSIEVFVLRCACLEGQHLFEELFVLRY